MVWIGEKSVSFLQFFFHFYNLFSLIFVFNSIFFMFNHSIIIFFLGISQVQNDLFCTTHADPRKLGFTIMCLTGYLCHKSANINFNVTFSFLLHVGLYDGDKQKSYTVIYNHLKVFYCLDKKNHYSTKALTTVFMIVLPLDTNSQPVELDTINKKKSIIVFATQNKQTPMIPVSESTLDILIV